MMGLPVTRVASKNVVMGIVATVSGTPLRERTAEEIRVVLARRRMSATKLARELGVSQAYVWRRLSGETAFDLDDLEGIAGVLKVSVFDLLPQRPPVTSGYRNVTQSSGRGAAGPTASRPSGGPAVSARRPSTGRPVLIKRRLPD